MVNYACAFTQSELRTYFEWIIKQVNAYSELKNMHYIAHPAYMYTQMNLQQIC